MKINDLVDSIKNTLHLTPKEAMVLERILCESIQVRQVYRICDKKYDRMDIVASELRQRVGQSIADECVVVSSYDDGRGSIVNVTGTFIFFD